MNKTRILLADDHAVVRTGIGKALSEVDSLEIAGEVGDGPALFDALARLQPDILLVDVTMPDFEAVADVRRIRDIYHSLKILVVSAYDDDAYVVGLLNAGVDGYHLKDQSLSDLRLAVQRVLAGERWLSSPLVDKLVSHSDVSFSAPPLTGRQRDILRWLQQGLDNQAIAQRMGLSVKTVENHLTRLYRQLNVQSRLEAVSYALQHPEVLALPGKEMAPTPISSETPAQERITMLLVDDNARYRRQLRRMVGKVCPQAMICEAENIGEAIRLVQRVAPRLVLVDVVLGDEDGISCTRRIKALSPTSRVILISAYPDREFHRLGLEAGAVAFLDKKDLDAATLRQVIDDVIA
jgi:DNA-binding NarL/FixJ family response regulator